jgi:hypothetical protein
MGDEHMTWRLFRSLFWHETVKLLTVAWAMGFTVVICYVWWSAAFNGDAILITINQYNEKWTELVLGLIFIPFMFYGFFLFLFDFAKKRKSVRRSLLLLLNKKRVETL